MCAATLNNIDISLKGMFFVLSFSISSETNIASSLVSQNPDIDVLSPLSLLLHNYLPYLPELFSIKEDAHFKIFFVER